MLTVCGVSSNHAHARARDVDAMGRRRCGGATGRAWQGLLSYGTGESNQTHWARLLCHQTRFPRTCTFRRRHLHPMAYVGLLPQRMLLPTRVTHPLSTHTRSNKYTTTSI